MAAPQQLKTALAGQLDALWDAWLAGTTQYQYCDRHNFAGRVYKIVIRKVAGDAQIFIRIQRRDSNEDSP